ncbi:cocaine esterase-like [Coccinella septempunctata]|uniref:cocaine esterase-like n=1 Tax=Coccinella septempunctata TaxID=41139 RepID=UPI001D09017A|nr:cocaine esterase-like [Coccinella septempunctata]
MSRLILLIFIFLATYAHSEDPIVQISNGKIKGEMMVTPYNRSFYAFRGIPYAKPPLGDLRFQAPQKPDNWTGILNSDAKDRICIQLYSQSQPNESEDCLYIHVYTPQIPSETQKVSLPVMYVIHGGGFAYGTPTPQELGPQYLMDYDVVVVTVGYRLGFLGFLSTGDLNCPGNYGLKDQQFGLRWVQDNIRHFGGDPKRVTIFGESAGAVSVGLHLLGENSEGLFIGAIQDSGSSLANWALQTSPKDIAYKLGKQIDSTINENNTSTSELVRIFRALDIPRLKKACAEVFGEGFQANYNDIYQGFLLTGTIEPKHDGAFLTKSPFQSLIKGDFIKVPTLLGINSEESLFLAEDPTLEDKMAYFDQNKELYVPPNMHISDQKTKKLVGEKITRMYDPSGCLHQNKAISIRFFSDTSFGRPTIKQAQLQSKYSDVFFYEFGYSGKMGKQFPSPDIPGKVCHSEEMMYIFHRSDAKDIFSFQEEDRITMKRMLTMWTNFVKYQNPTPECLEILQSTIWPKISNVDEMPYLSINNSLEVKVNLKKQMMEGYQQLYDEYAVPPLDTY